MKTETQTATETVVKGTKKGQVTVITYPKHSQQRNNETRAAFLKRVGTYSIVRDV